MLGGGKGCIDRLHLSAKEKQIMGILIDDFSTGTDSFNVTTDSDNRTQTGNKIIGG